MIISNNKTTMYENLKHSINSSQEIIMNVSFIRDSGLKLLIPDLIKAKQQGKKIKVLTTDYMNVTEPNALYRLIDISQVKIFNNIKNRSYHPKTYIFKNDENFEIYIGSSNISYSALISGVEWNYHFIGNRNNSDIHNILLEFEELFERNSFDLTLEWLRKYEKSYQRKEVVNLVDTPNIEMQNLSPTSKEIEPIKFQIPALYELSKTREEGYKKGLVIVGTGLGKTYLSAFDTMNFNKILFIAHRDEILKDAKKAFETIYGNSKSYGFFNGYEKEHTKDIIFASISTISKAEYLKDNIFPKDYFDYIIVDEFHHASASSYQNVLEYFKPKFLLGLTATPDRADNGDIYKLCDYNIVYECDFKTGINNGWLVPFEYFGIYDDTDYSLIPWRNGKYNLEELENKLIVEKRIELVYEKYINYRKKSTIGFCASVKHCEFMNSYFKKKKIPCEMIVGTTSISQRQQIISDFKNGKLEVIFTVDVFNEGVDIPCIDTILFLRPTTSYTIFIQQLGRGLRTYQNKEKLRILDFVGNYKGAELKPWFLMGHSKKSMEKLSPLSEKFILPNGCSANFEFKIIEQFEKNKQSPLLIQLTQDYKDVEKLLNKKPTIMDIYTFGKLPIHTYLQKYKSWYKFLEKIDELSTLQKNFSTKAQDFLYFLEHTSMTKSYKIPLLLSLFKNGLKNSISLEDIGKYYKEFYSDKLHGKDLNNKKHDDWENWTLKKYEKLAKENPIHFLTKDYKNIEFFTFIENKFRLNSDLYKEILSNKELIENILDRLEYRNINYFRRKYMEDECR